jgi:hypothetical protein
MTARYDRKAAAAPLEVAEGRRKARGGSTGEFGAAQGQQNAIRTEAPNDLRTTINDLNTLAGRGSRIRTCDLKYPKLPRYQAALYPEC